VKVIGDSFFDGDVEYVPIIWEDGRVGYQVNDDRAPEGRPHTFIYFNPSINDDGSDPNVFIYMGEAGDPVYDGPQCYIDVEFPSGDYGDISEDQSPEAIAEAVERADAQRAAAQDDPRGERDR